MARIPFHFMLAVVIGQDMLRSQRTPEQLGHEETLPGTVVGLDLGCSSSRVGLSSETHRFRDKRALLVGLSAQSAQRRGD